MSNFKGAMATKLANQKATEMLEPLLPIDEGSSTDDGNSTGYEEEEYVKQTPFQILKMTAVYVMLGAGVAACTASMIFSPQILVFIAGGICCANVPYSVYKERQLAKIPTLRYMNNILREDANHLTDEVEGLSEQISCLEPEAERASAIEEELRVIADKQKFNVDKLINLVKENEEILTQMRVNLRQRIVQDVVGLVMKSDNDNDHTISLIEAKTLALKIEVQLGVYGVEFDSEKFLKVIGINPSVTHVISIVQKLMPSNEEGSEVDDEDSNDYDMFFIVEDNGSAVDEDESSAPSNTSLGYSPLSHGHLVKSLKVDNDKRSTASQRSIDMSPDSLAMDARGGGRRRRMSITRMK